GPTKRGTRLENGVIISTKARDSKNFVAMMQFVDWLYYSDAGQLLSKWGVKDQTYTGSVEDGSFKLASDVDWAGLNPTGTKKLNVDYGFSNGVFAYGGRHKLRDTMVNAGGAQIQRAMCRRSARCRWAGASFARRIRHTRSPPRSASR